MAATIRAKILSYEDAISHSFWLIWIQTRDMAASVPAMYVSEHYPFLRFQRVGFGGEPIMFYVRKDYYGKTWRCFDKCPHTESTYYWDDSESIDWEEEEDK